MIINIWNDTLEEITEVRFSKEYEDCTVIVPTDGDKMYYITDGYGDSAHIRIKDTDNLIKALIKAKQLYEERSNNALNV